MEQRERKAKDLLKVLLQLEYCGALFVCAGVSACRGDEQLIVDLRSAPPTPWLTSFSPKENTGTSSAPSLMATLTNPNRFFSVRSCVPGCAASDSAAPPTTIVIALPGPIARIFLHDVLDTEQMPRNSRNSR